jgi:hypothetical protein
LPPWHCGLRGAGTDTVGHSVFADARYRGMGDQSLMTAVRHQETA